MKKILLIGGLIGLGFSGQAQVNGILCHVDPTGLFYVGKDALVYNGGGIQTRGTGLYDIHGNVMVVGDGTNFIKTLNSDLSAKDVTTQGGNIILRLNNPGNYTAPSISSGGTGTNTYGQLYIKGLPQGNITGIVDKEYNVKKNGTYQQVALPFNNKTISTLSTELVKNFSNTRWSQNEVLTWNNATAVSDNLSISSTTPKNTAYYMLGSKSLDTGAPTTAQQYLPLTGPASTSAGNVYVVHGVPYADGISETLQNAAANINFGAGGTSKNYYNELYNTYLQDNWEFSSSLWAGTYGKNIYQYGNPFLTNLDLSGIGYLESGLVTDGNAISTIVGIRYDPGTVNTMSSGATYSTGALFQDFVIAAGANQGKPVGDVGLIVPPMQTFVIKLSSAASQSLNFDTLRRFNYITRDQTGASYSVTAAKSASAAKSTSTVKQLGVFGLDANGKEIARTYFVVYPEATSGHTNKLTTQATASSGNILGTFEEDPINGGYDNNYTSSYWLYINEANEIDIKGKAIPLDLYSSDIKSLKFVVLEDAKPVANGAQTLSSGIGFYYQPVNGAIANIAQNQVIPVSGNVEYKLYYGKPATTSSAIASNIASKPSRTMVVYNPTIDNYMIKFDPNWNKADVKVFDMSGKLILSKKVDNTSTDYVLDLAKLNQGYVVTATSEKGEKVNSKIVR